MSKPKPRPVPEPGTPKTSARHWLGRLFRNSYTRQGRIRRVRKWSVKLQHLGVRRTISLRSPDRAAAAEEALALYKTIVGHGWEAALRTRPSDLEAVRKARRIQRAIGTEGMAVVAGRFSRELTVAIHWVSNPVIWTYFTLRTRPGGPRRPGNGRSASESWPMVVVEPDPALGEALKECLQAQSLVHQVRVLSRTADVLPWLDRNRAALLLVNREVGEIMGDTVLDGVRLAAPQMPGVVYSVHDDSDALFSSTPGGAVGYLLKRTAPGSPLEPLADRALVPWPSPQQVAERVRLYFQRLIGAPPDTLPNLELARLTVRELEILGLVSKGYPDKEVADALGISGWTVHGHVKRIYEKLGVHSRTEAVVKYLQK